MWLHYISPTRFKSLFLTAAFKLHYISPTRFKPLFLTAAFKSCNVCANTYFHIQSYSNIKPTDFVCENVMQIFNIK